MKPCLCIYVGPVKNCGVGSRGIFVCVDAYCVCRCDVTLVPQLVLFSMRGCSRTLLLIFRHLYTHTFIQSHKWALSTSTTRHSCDMYMLRARGHTQDWCVCVCLFHTRPTSPNYRILSKFIRNKLWGWFIVLLCCSIRFHVFFLNVYCVRKQKNGSVKSISAGLKWNPASQ